MSFSVDESGYITSTSTDVMVLHRDAKGLVRQELLRQVDPLLVKAAWLVFKSRCKPADLNELVEHKEWVGRVMRDNPRLVPLIYSAVFMDYLVPQPENTLVARFKDLLQAKKTKSPIFDLFSEDPDSRPLTDAGWKLLLAQPVSFHRQWADKLWGLAELVYVLNLFAEHNRTQLQPDLVSLAIRLRFKHVPLRTLRQLFSAAPDNIADAGELSKQVDAIAEWVTQSMPDIAPGTTWRTLVNYAVAFAYAQERTSGSAIASVSWHSPLELKQQIEGWTISVCNTGALLLREGEAMNNCLNTGSVVAYVQKGLLGQSLVLSGYKGHSRVTLEYARKSADSPWALAQCEGVDGAPQGDSPDVQPLLRELRQLLSPR